MVDPAHPLSSIEKPKPSVSSDDGRAFRRLPGTRWSAIRLNWRWMVQGLALIAGIFFFMRAFNTSKTLWMSFSWLGLGGLAAWILLFGCCFAVLLFTSYLKERGTRTLRHRITVFEKLIVWLGLHNYSENIQPSHHTSPANFESLSRDGREKPAA